MSEINPFMVSIFKYRCMRLILTSSMLAMKGLIECVPFMSINVDCRVFITFTMVQKSIVQTIIYKMYTRCEI